ncbi:14033_t:CDS:2, partial [Racocetra persica]
KTGRMCAPIKRDSFQNSEEYTALDGIENAKLTCKCGMNVKK